MISVNQAHLFVAARSHPGMSGKVNEDRYAVTAYQLKKRRATPVILAIVTDGIGGHRAGEVAAEMAVEMVRKVVSSSDATRPVDILREAILRANQAIIQKAESDRNLQGMGTTCACGWVIGERLYTSSIGDTRIYLARDNAIQQISTDHTWVQEAIDSGVLAPDQAHSHPNAHVIRRYLGSRNLVVPDTRLRLRPGETDAQSEANQGHRLQPGDQVLLCSDGLTDLVAEEEILAILKNNRQEQALDQLISLANQRGGHDNITVVALEVPRVTPRAVQSTRSWQRAFMAFMATMVVLLIGAGVTLAGYTYLKGMQDNRDHVTPTNLPMIGKVTAPVFPVFSSPTATLTSGTDAFIRTETPWTPTPDRTPLATLTPWPTNTLQP
jgi:serine/threonine protein phosphatase PrpC